VKEREAAIGEFEIRLLVVLTNDSSEDEDAVFQVADPFSVLDSEQVDGGEDGVDVMRGDSKRILMITFVRFDHIFRSLR